MPSSDPVAEVVALLGRRPPRAPGTQVIAVDGPSGAGKTTLAARLSDALHGAPVVHMDDLYPGWDGLADAVRMARGIARDGEAYRPHWERWARQEREHFAVDGTRDRADVVVWTGPTRDSAAVPEGLPH